MGQKVNSNAVRLGISQGWKSSWFANSKQMYKDNVAQDLIIKKFVKKAFRPAGLEDVIVRRNGNMIEVEVSVARPGVAIGRGGEGIENVKKELALMINKAVEVKISEVKKADVSAAIIARSIAEGVERRQPPKLLMASHKEKAMAAGAKGIKIWVSGRIGGASQARTMKVSEGPVPLQTLRAEIEYAEETAHTMDSGLMGIKVWVYNPQDNMKQK